VTFEDQTVKQAALNPEDAKDVPPPWHWRWWASRQRELYHRAAGCCVGSEWAAQSVISDYGIPEERVHVVGRGHGFVTEAVERDWTSPRYLFSGRDWHRKNGDRVIEAFTYVRTRWPMATLDIVGPGPPSKARLADVPGVSYHGELRLENRDDRARLKALYRSSTCFVMPSIAESFGISFVEAAAYGLPSVGTTAGGSKTAIGEAGLLTDPLDVNSIADGMLALAAPDTARRLGGLARERSVLFAWPSIAKRLLAVLETGRLPDELRVPA
jgi:glycosyltransferase involved in cell wall biosynthesis